MNRRWLLVYDSSCSLCVKFKNLAKSLDRRKRIEEASLSDSRIQDWAPGFDPQKIAKNFHLILPDGRVATGEMALPELLGLLPAGRPLAWVLRNLPGSRRLMFQLLKWLSKRGIPSPKGRGW